MKTNHVLATLALLAFASPALAAPAFIPYAGRLTDGAGPATATATLIVRLYDCPVAGDPSCGSTQPWFTGKHPNVPVVDGYFSLNIGERDAEGNVKAIPSESALTADLPAQLWLTVAPEGGSAPPRQPVGSVPYALAAVSAESASLSASTQDLEGVALRKVQTAAAAALCIAFYNSDGKTNGTAAIYRFDYSTDFGAEVCNRKGATGVSKSCYGVVTVSAAENHGGFATNYGCADSYPTAYQNLFACCDD